MAPLVARGPLLEQPQTGDAVGQRQQVVVGTDWRAAHKVLTKQLNLLFDDRGGPRRPPEPAPGSSRRTSRGTKRWTGSAKVVGTDIDELITLPSGLIFQVIIDLIVQQWTAGCGQRITIPSVTSCHCAFHAPRRTARAVLRGGTHPRVQEPTRDHLQRGPDQGSHPAKAHPRRHPTGRTGQSPM